MKLSAVRGWLSLARSLHCFWFSFDFVAGIVSGCAENSPENWLFLGGSPRFHLFWKMSGAVSHEFRLRLPGWSRVLASWNLSEGHLGSLRCVERLALSYYDSFWLQQLCSFSLGSLVTITICESRTGCQRFQPSWKWLWGPEWGQKASGPHMWLKEQVFQSWLWSRWGTSRLAQSLLTLVYTQF